MKIIRKDGKESMSNDRKVLELMAEYFLDTREAGCLLCNNCMKNITIRKEDSIQGCDGNCSWSKRHDKYDLIKLFEKESLRND